ncbi:unnamed protein product [Pleuronectes platessa]|uniref:Uncharacterized protein n=1 Tax=Pleuronectes platessa TaxID=8262 RepID=A0A9N7UI20_PLEPL|nr:unnamed protein product [Pleuronectes platessa]
MAEYKLEVSTGYMPSAGTWDHVYVTLIGSDGESEKTELDNWGRDFYPGKIGTYTVKTSSSLGKLLLVKVEKEPFLYFQEEEWYCSTIEVTTPGGDAILFPCHRWISREEYVELRGGRAMKYFEEDYVVLIEHRKKELTFQKSLYQWKPLAEGLLHISSFENVSELPAEIRFRQAKAEEIQKATKQLGMKFKFEGMVGSAEKWKDLDDLKRLFNFQKTPMSEYIAEHWKEDDFYGYQFLNGINPTLIKRCSELPRNFPVTEEMVKPFLAEGSSLMREIGTPVTMLFRFGVILAPDSADLQLLVLGSREEMGRSDPDRAVHMKPVHELLSPDEPNLWLGDVQLEEPVKEALWFKFLQIARGCYIWEGKGSPARDLTIIFENFVLARTKGAWNLGRLAHVLVKALVISDLDCFNSLQAGLPASAIQSLQLVQNATAGLYCYQLLLPLHHPSIHL